MSGILPPWLISLLSTSLRFLSRLASHRIYQRLRDWELFYQQVSSTNRYEYLKLQKWCEYEYHGLNFLLRLIVRTLFVFASCVCLFFFLQMMSTVRPKRGVAVASTTAATSLEASQTSRKPVREGKHQCCCANCIRYGNKRVTRRTCRLHMAKQRALQTGEPALKKLRWR